MRSVRSVTCVMLVAAAGCAGPVRPTPQGWGDGPVTYNAGQGRWGERYPIEVTALPAVWLRPDLEDRFGAGELAPDATGSGVAVRSAIGNRDQSIGVLYHGMWLDGDDDRRDGDVDAHALYFDADVRVPVRDGPKGLYGRAAVGLGFVRYDLAGTQFDDRTTGAANLRFDVEFEPPGQRWSLLFGIGGFAWGRPGDNDAYGTFFEIGGRVTL